MCPRKLAIALRIIAAALGTRQLARLDGAAMFRLAPGSYLLVQPESAGRLRFQVWTERGASYSMWTPVGDLERIERLARAARREAHLQPVG